MPYRTWFQYVMRLRSLLRHSFTSAYREMEMNMHLELSSNIILRFWLNLHLKPTLSLRVGIWFTLFQGLLMIHISMRVLHMCENYGHHATTVFYGYDSSNVTKGFAQRQRAARATAGDFLFDLDPLRQTHQRSSLFNKQWKQIQTDIIVYD